LAEWGGGLQKEGKKKQYWTPKNVKKGSAGKKGGDGASHTKKSIKKTLTGEILGRYPGTKKKGEKGKRNLGSQKDGGSQGDTRRVNTNVGGKPS